MPILRILPSDAAGQRSRPCMVCHREIRPGKTGLCRQCWKKGELKAAFFETAREHPSGPLLFRKLRIAEKIIIACPICGEERHYAGRSRLPSTGICGACWRKGSVKAAVFAARHESSVAGSNQKVEGQ